MFTSQSLRDLVQVRLFPDVVLSKSSVVVVRLSEYTTLVTPDILSCQAVAAMAARTSMVAPTSSITDLELGDVASNSFDNANSLMT